MGKFIDLTGKTYGVFVITRYLGHRFYLLRCKKCGHEIKRRNNQIMCDEVRRTCPNCKDILTNMEYQVAKLVMRGLRNKQIAEYLSISDRTVGAHLAHIYDKLKLNNRTELMGYMFKRLQGHV